ncbi:condensin complex protein MksE [Litoribacillus peritrichatus]|uniref:DUF4194 domain-containing protein n=1 Tax=Litoribacillus peritrichatus TaxID=718191 RepID=A0ABP7M109_9GAMM
MNQDLLETPSVERESTDTFTRPAINIDLSKMRSMTPIYQKLMSGFHITEANLTLWQELDQFNVEYEQLFKGLGYTLIKDARGYFYFSSPDTTVTMTKTSRRIALLVYTLIEHWADKGYDPIGALFDQPLNKDVCRQLYDKNINVFEQIDINSAADIQNEILKRMARLGFAKEQGKEHRLLPSCYRYIDAVMELSDAYKQDEQATFEDAE